MLLIVWFLPTGVFFYTLLNLRFTSCFLHLPTSKTF